MYYSHLILIPLDSPLLAEWLPQRRRVALTVEYSPPFEDWELRASATIAKYGIEQSESESSSSPLYTAHNTPSSSKRNSEDQEKLRWTQSPKIVFRGSSPDSPRRRNNLGCNKTPSTISSRCYNGYQSPELRRRLRTQPLLRLHPRPPLRQPLPSVSRHAD